MKQFYWIVVIICVLQFGCKKEEIQKVNNDSPPIENKLDSTSIQSQLADMKYNFEITVNENTNSIDVNGYIKVGSAGFVVREVSAYRDNNENNLYIHFSHPKGYKTDTGNMNLKLNVKKSLKLDTSGWSYATNANLILWNNNTPLPTIQIDKQMQLEDQDTFANNELTMPKELGGGTIPITTWTSKN